MELRKLANMVTITLFPSLSLFSLLLTFTSASTDTFIYGGCSRVKYVPNSPYESTLDSLLTSLVTSAAYTPYNKFTINSSQNDVVSVVYGLYQCRPDISTRDCFACIQRALSQLGVLCVDSCGGAIQLDGCFLKYDNATFLGAEDKTVVMRKCGSQQEDGDDSGELTRVLSYLESGSNELFRVGEGGRVKGVAQCVGDMSGTQCQDCLGEAIGRVKSECGPARWADMFLGKCYVRYSTGGDRTFGSNGSSQDDEIEKTLAILIGLIAGVALIIIFLAFLRKLCDGKDGK